MKVNKIVTILIGFCMIFSLFLFTEKVKSNSIVDTPKKFKAISNSSNSIKLSWKKVENADGYEIFVNKSGEYKKYKKIKNNKTKSLVIIVKKNKTYKYKIRSYKYKGKKKYTSDFSYVVKARSLNSKKQNVRKLVTNNSSVSVTQGKTKKLNIQFNPKTRLLSKNLKCNSNNERIVTVTNKGKIKGINPGKTKVTCRSHNGYVVKFNITVKFAPTDNIKVLTFHRIVSDNVKKTYYKDDQWVASVKDFEQQIKYLYDNGYKTLSMDEFYNWYKGKTEYSKKTVVLTFDDGDYTIYYLVMPILEKYNMKATEFVVGSRTESTTHEYIDNADRYYIGKDLINKTKQEYPNLEYQSHTYNMHYRVGDNFAINTKTLVELNQDFDNMKSFGFKYMAWPYGQYNDLAEEAFNNSDIKLAFQFGRYRTKGATRKDSPYAIWRAKVNGQISFDDYKKLINN